MTSATPRSAAASTNPFALRHPHGVLRIAAVVVIVGASLIAAIYLIEARQQATAQDAAVSAVATVNAVSAAVADAQSVAALASDLRYALTAAAIREGRAITGMTRYEVRAARGTPAVERFGETLLKPYRDAGAAEAWVYRYGPEGTVTVLFDHTGRVIYSTDETNRSTGRR